MIDHVKSIQTLGCAYWKKARNKNLQVGDICYLYLIGKGHYQIRFRLEVVDISCAREDMYFFKASPEDFLIIYDDIDLDVGRIRLRQKGSAGGHNGIKSIIQCLGTSNFDRIRVGTTRDPQIPIINWVLTKFKAEEMDALYQAIEKASQAAYYSIDHTFAQTMNQYNTK